MAPLPFVSTASKILSTSSSAFSVLKIFSTPENDKFLKLSSKCFKI